MDGHLSAWGEAAVSSWQKEIPAECTRTGRKRQASATGVSPQLLWCLPAQHSWGQDHSHVLPNCTRTSVWVSPGSPWPVHHVWPPRAHQGTKEPRKCKRWMGRGAKAGHCHGTPQGDTCKGLTCRNHHEEGVMVQPQAQRPPPRARQQDPTSRDPAVVSSPPGYPQPREPPALQLPAKSRCRLPPRVFYQSRIQKAQVSQSAAVPFPAIKTPLLSSLLSRGSAGFKAGASQPRKVGQAASLGRSRVSKKLFHVCSGSFHCFSRPAHLAKPGSEGFGEEPAQERLIRPPLK